MNKYQETFFDALHCYDRRDFNFKIVTRLTVDEALAFYKAKGCFPTEKDTDGIRYLGIDLYLDLLQRYEKIDVPKTLKQDLEKLGSARARFIDQCKLVWYKFFHR